MTFHLFDFWITFKYGFSCAIRIVSFLSYDEESQRSLFSIHIDHNAGWWFMNLDLFFIIRF